MKQTHAFDCRSICDGKRCPYLYPKIDIRVAKIIRMFICKDKNSVIIPEIENSGNITEQLTSVSPINNCLQMRKLQSEGVAQWADYSINADGIGTHWNPIIDSL